MSGDGRWWRRSRLRVSLVVVLALVVGVAGGYALRTVTEPAPPPARVPPTQQAAPAAPEPAPAPCIAVADRAEELTVELERAVQAVAALDPTALREIVNEVERIHDGMQPAVQACRTASAGG